MARAIFRRLLSAAFLILASVLPGIAAQDIFSVAGVPVDVTGESAIAARDQAIAQGQREGLRRLLRRLTVSEYFGLLPDVGGVELGPIVKSFGVENEQVAANRYVAEVAASYHGDRIRALLQGRGVPIVLAASPPILIVPARLIDGQIVAFDSEDPWSQAWNRGANRNTLLDVVLPLGDLLDVTRLPRGAAGAIVETGLAALAERYDAKSAILMLAEGTAADGSTITIRAAASRGWEFGFDGFALAADDERLWARGVAGALSRLEERWKPRHLVRFDQIEQLQLSATLGDLSSWTQIDRALRAMPEIEAFELERFSQTRAEFRIRFIGGLTQLRQSFENRGLGLTEQAGQWRLASPRTTSIAE